MTNQTYKSWKKRITKKIWHKSEINAFTKLLASQKWSNGTDRWYRIEEILSKTSPNYEVRFVQTYGEEVQQCRALFFQSPRAISREQTSFGISWLKNFCFKSNGQPRETKNNLDMAQRSVVKNFKKFSFVGVLGHPNGLGEIVAYTPIYRVHAKSGDWFDYSPLHWGNPVVLGGAFCRN